MIELLSILPGLLVPAVVFAIKFKADADMYRGAWREMRHLYNWEREQNKWLCAALEAERKRQKDGPYR